MDEDVSLKELQEDLKRRRSNLQHEMNICRHTIIRQQLISELLEKEIAEIEVAESNVFRQICELQRKLVK